MVRQTMLGEAAVLAYCDCYLAIALSSLLSLTMTLFLRTSPRPRRGCSTFRTAREGRGRTPLCGSSIEEVSDHPQAKALDMMPHGTHRLGGGLRMLGVPMPFSRLPTRAQQPAPTLDEPTQAVLHSQGYSVEQ